MNGWPIGDLSEGLFSASAASLCCVLDGERAPMSLRTPGARLRSPTEDIGENRGTGHQSPEC